MVRRRRYTILMKRGTAAWVGNEAEFHTLFSRRVIASGEVFFAADDETLGRACASMLRRACWSPDTHASAVDDWPAF